MVESHDTLIRDYRVAVHDVTEILTFVKEVLHDVMHIKRVKKSVLEKLQRR